jgi:hypothetical protein
LPGKHWTTPLKSLLSEKNTQCLGGCGKAALNPFPKPIENDALNS